jgi:hypothetical protein
MTNLELVLKYLKNIGVSRRVGNLTLEEGKLFSYSTIIARFEHDILLVTSNHYSPTTDKHVNLLVHNYDKIIFVDYKFLVEKFSKKEQLNLMIETIDDKARELNAKKRKDTKVFEYLNSQHTDLICNCLDFMDLYKLKTDLNKKLTKIN